MLPHRPDPRIESEDGQAAFRLSMTLAVSAFSAAGSLLWSTGIGERELACVAAYLGYAYGWTWLVYKRVGNARLRQWAAVLLDHVVFGMCLALGGKGMAFVAWVSVTTSVGHGLRFGRCRGTAAALLGGSAIFCATSFGPLWHLPSELALGMAATAVIAPLYVVRLVQTMDSQRRQSEARAAALESAVRLDGLTGVLSRRGFEEAWEQLADKSGFSELNVGLVYLDLDGFKAVNDTHGHDVGDETLRQVAKLLSAGVRNTDAVARLGGDEFVILVRAPTSRKDVEQVAAKAAESVRTLRVQGVVSSLGASAGVVFVQAGASLHGALREADELMFEDKRRRKASADAGPPPTSSPTRPGMDQREAQS